jgi:hypothetical protein
MSLWCNISLHQQYLANCSFHDHKARVACADTAGQVISVVQSIVVLCSGFSISVEKMGIAIVQVPFLFFFLFFAND